jgi:hypothetical protein
MLATWYMGDFNKYIIIDPTLFKPKHDPNNLLIINVIKTFKQLSELFNNETDLIKFG